MSESRAPQIVLAARPHGKPKLTDFGLVETTIPILNSGQVLLETLYLARPLHARSDG